MVRHEAYRTRKYEGKIDPDAIRMRILALKDMMVEQVEAKFAELALVERKAKHVCEAAGVTTMLIPAYLNFARECYRISKNFSQTTRNNEIYIMYSKWVSRGFDSTVLGDVGLLCGFDVAEYGA